MSLLFFGGGANVSGQYSISGTGEANKYVQDFNAFQGTNATIPSNWSLSATPSGYYNRTPLNNFSSNNMYALRESSSSTDNAIGGKVAANSGTCSGTGTRTITFTVKNTTGANITGFVVTWNVEQYSYGGRLATLNLTHNFGGTTTGTPNFTAGSGTDGQNTTSILTTARSINISNLTLANNATGIFTFTICTGSGSNNNGHIGIDDFTMYATAEEAPTNDPEPDNHATSFSCGTTGATNIPLTWTDATGTNKPSKYLIKWSSVSYAAITTPTDGTPETDGAGKLNVNYGIEEANITGLTPNTTYYFKIFPYSNSGDSIDYKTDGTVPQTSCDTQDGPCVSESFTNIPASNSSYLGRSWTGDDGGTWNATEARTDRTLNGKAITTNGSGSITSSIYANGMGKLKFNYVRDFTGTGGRTIQVYVNGNKIGDDITVSTNSDTVVEYSRDINIPGNVKLELFTSGSQIKIDDIQWTCYSGLPIPKINIQGNNITIADGDTTPSASDGTDFGSAILAGAEVERTFKIQNLGSADLTLDNPTVTFSDGTKGFSVSAQPVTNPMTGFTDQTFKIKFSNTTPATYTETVIIRSDDPDTPAYSFDVKAVVLEPVITVSETALSGFTYPEAQGPSTPLQSFTVSGSNLAGNVTVTASANWEISTNNSYDGINVTPWQTRELAKNMSNSLVNTTVYVRLKAGLPEGSYTGTVTMTSPNATDKIVNLSGTVTAPVPVINVGGVGNDGISVTAISNGSTNPIGANRTEFASQNLGESQTNSYEIKNTGGAQLSLGAITIYGTGVSAFAVEDAPELGTILAPNQTLRFKIKFAPTTIGTKTATVSIENSDASKNPFTFDIKGGATYCSSTGEVIVVARQDFEVTPAAPVMAYTTTNFGAVSPGGSTGFSTGNSGNSSNPANNNLYSEGARGYRIQGSSENGSSGVMFTFDNVDVSTYTGSYLSFRVAGFSLGTTGNGMDYTGPGSGSDDPVPDAQKTDYVLVEVSPDGGTTWYQQAKVVSDELNLAWSFGSSGTISGARTYSADNDLTYFKSKTSGKYSSITIQNLPQVSNLKVRISTQNNNPNESWILDDIRITSTGLVPKVWNGTNWVPSNPVSSDKAIIDGDYNSLDNGGFKVCQCEIKEGKTVTVSPDNPITVTDFMLNNGNIVVENNANFIQINEDNTNSGAGTFTVKRESKMKRLDYTYWSSSVANQQLKAFSPNTQQSRFYEYHENDDLFYTVDWNTNFVPAKGYTIRAFNNYPTNGTVQTFTGIFAGQPNNGNQTFTLSYTPVTLPDNPTHVEAGYNLTGNPYPSNIDFEHLVDSNIDNSTNKSLIYKNAWFWTNTNLNPPQQQGSNYSGDNYAIYTGSGGLAVPHTYSTGEFGTSATPTRYIKVGQGFMIKAKSTSGGKDLVFTNSTRTASNAHFFPAKTETSVDRYWLMLITPVQNVYSLLVAYIEGATNGLEGDYDAKRMGMPSDDFYTVLNDEKLAIQGRQYPLDITDVVPLGNRFFEAGQYTIGIENAEGIFAGLQPIYLKDKQTGILTDLSKGNYTFTADAGEIMGRFEVVYRSETVLGTNEKLQDNLLVSRNGNDFVIKSQNKKITAVEMYDSSGRLVYTAKANSTEVTLHSEKFANGMYILKINRGEEVTSRKIIK